MEGDLSHLLSSYSPSLSSTPNVTLSADDNNSLNNIFNNPSSANVNFPLPFNNSSSNFSSISPLLDSTPVRRGPGRPRKDGRGAVMRKS